MARSSSAHDALVSPTVVAVYEHLLDEIFDGTRAPGSIIRDVEIAETLGVSRTPVREALQMLRSEGMVEVLPSRFTRVAVISLEEIDILGGLALAIYKYGLEVLIEEGRPAPLAELEREFDAGVAAANDTVVFFRHAFRFHDLVVQAIDDAHFSRAANAVYGALRLGLMTHQNVAQAQALLLGERQILDALRTRDQSLSAAAIESLRGMGEARHADV